MRIWLLLVLAIPAALYAQASLQSIATLRGDTPISEQPVAPRMDQVENFDIRRQRNYPMQPPTIPHKIDGYQVDLNQNRCLTCHSRSAIADSQAPMVSVTHFMDREGNFLAEISPRRYFCNQCHVPLTAAKPLVGNYFEDMHDVIGEETRKQPQ